MVVFDLCSRFLDGTVSIIAEISWYLYVLLLFKRLKWHKLGYLVWLKKKNEWVVPATVKTVESM
jgi:hypothetical protein